MPHEGLCSSPDDPPSALAAPAARAGCTARTALAAPAAPAMRFGSRDLGRVWIVGAMYVLSLWGQLSGACLNPKNSNP